MVVAEAVIVAVVVTLVVDTIKDTKVSVKNEGFLPVIFV